MEKQVMNGLRKSMDRSAKPEPIKKVKEAP